VSQEGSMASGETREERRFVAQQARQLLCQMVLDIRPGTRTQLDDQLDNLSTLTTTQVLVEDIEDDRALILGVPQTADLDDR
jgi:hypothetical protein